MGLLAAKGSDGGEPMGPGDFSVGYRIAWRTRAKRRGLRGSLGDLSGSIAALYEQRLVHQCRSAAAGVEGSIYQSA